MVPILDEVRTLAGQGTSDAGTGAFAGLYSIGTAGTEEVDLGTILQRSMAPRRATATACSR